jgi:hypothetical protein
VFDNEILFKYCLFYLTLFEYRGITENEMEDILSIEDEVLDHGVGKQKITYTMPGWVVLFGL